MSDRYITLRSFAVRLSSLRMVRHLSLDVPITVQQPCRVPDPACQTSQRPRKARFSRTLPARPRTGLPRINNRCRVWATPLTLVLLLVGLWASPAGAQSRPETPEDRPPNAPADQPVDQPSDRPSLLSPITRDGTAAPGSSGNAERVADSRAATEPSGGATPLAAEGYEALPEVTFEQTLDAFRTVRGWLDRGGVPDLDGTPVPAAWVASVTVRFEGRVVGQHTTVAQSREQVDESLRVAAVRAIERTVAQLQGPPDALRRERLSANLARTTLSIELSTGAPTPVPAGVTAAELDQWLRPGLEGMLLSRDGFRRARTPAQMLATGRTASATLVTLVAELADDPASALTPYEELAGAGYALSFFRVRHAAQTTPDAPPLVLHRGGAIVPPVRTDDLAALANRIAAHLRARAWPGVERLGLRDGLDPVAGTWDRGGGSPFAQALAAEALLRYARLRAADPSESAQARRAGEATLAALAVVEGSERAPWGDPATASACVNALAALDPGTIERSAELRGLRERCLPVVDGAYSASEGFDPLLPATAKGVVARALVALAGFEPWNREAHLMRADAAIRAAFRDTPASALLSLMPDLAWADLALAAQTGIDPPSAPALRALRTRLLDLQLNDADLSDMDRDLAGGFVLDAGGSPLPTWQSARPVALLGTMLGEPSLTRGTLGSGEVVANLIDLSESLRFLAQLTAGERVAHMYADPAVAVGGVRTALWDQSMPLTASALGLLAVTESLESFEAVAGRNGAAAGRP